MEFVDIKNGDKVFPGEYLYHKPSKDIVICGGINNNIVKAIYKGKIINDDVSKFKKIKLSRQEEKARRREKSCSSCKKR